MLLKDGARFDVVVVGAGPAGSIAASEAARRGASTLLLEKRPVIGSPVRCAEGITSEMLASCGLKLRDEWISHKLHGARVFSPSGHSIKVDSSANGGICGYMLDREKFDMGLAADAADAGACVMAGSPVLALSRADDRWKLEVRSASGMMRVHTPIVIGADGFESQLARWAGWDNCLHLCDTLSCAEFTLDRIKGDASNFEFHLDVELAPGGYAWVFWKGEGCANVGVGMRGDRLDCEAAPLRALEKFIASKPWLSTGRRIRAIVGGAPIAMPPKSNAKDGLMLVGDAARVCDSLHGGGIANAIITGRLAGENASRILDGMSPEEAGAEYDLRWHERLDQDLKLAYAMKEMFGAASNHRIDEVVLRLQDESFDLLEPRAMMEKVIDRHPHLRSLLT